MKTLFTFFITAIILIGCAKKIITPITNTLPNNKPIVVVISNEVNTHITEMTVAAGKQIFTTKCVRCHQLKPAENYTASQWVNIMASMAPKARLDSTEKANVMAYVKLNSKK